MNDFARPVPVPGSDGRAIVRHPVNVLSSEEVEMLVPVVLPGTSLPELLNSRERDDPQRLVSMKICLLYMRYETLRVNSWTDELLAAVRDASRRGTPCGSEDRP